MWVNNTNKFEYLFFVLFWDDSSLGEYVMESFGRSDRVSRTKANMGLT